MIEIFNDTAQHDDLLKPYQMFCNVDIIYVKGKIERFFHIDGMGAADNVRNDAEVVLILIKGEEYLSRSG